jgi:hypothetical protein
LFPAVDGDIGAYVLRWCEAIHPNKAAAVGRASVRGLVRQCTQTAGAIGVRGSHALVVFIAIAFMLGACFDVDPMFASLRPSLRRQDSGRDVEHAMQMHRAAMHYLSVIRAR